MISTPKPLLEFPLARAQGRECHGSLRSIVQDVLDATTHATRTAERRRQRRIPYPYLFKIAPFVEEGVGEGGAIVVAGKHLSLGGIGFYHRDPLPFKQVTAWLEHEGKVTCAVLVELLWCRFNRQGWYENGGRFVRLVDSSSDA